MISRILIFCSYFSLLMAPPPALAVVDMHSFDSETDRQRYRQFVEELRCPKCQNQNLDGSDAPIAKDLRRELYRLLQDGKTDTEIVDFMVNRYGDYVLYRPRLQQNTLVLWGLPLVLVCLGALVFGLILRRRRVRVDAAGDATIMEALTDRERERLDQLLIAEEEQQADGSGRHSHQQDKGQH